jgi:hypothetical protein
VRRGWEPEDLNEVWTPCEDDMKRVRNKSRATRLRRAPPLSALLLKSFEVESQLLVKRAKAQVFTTDGPQGGSALGTVGDHLLPDLIGLRRSAWCR